MVNAGYLREDRYDISTDLGITYSTFPPVSTLYDNMAKFSKSGVVKVGNDSIGYELVQYTSTQEDANGYTTRLLGCTRGAFGTSGTNTTARSYTNVATNKIGVVEVGMVKIDNEIMFAEPIANNKLRIFGERGPKIYGSLAVAHSNGAAIYTSSLMGAGFSTTGAAAGLWDVIVTNPDTMAATITSGFTIFVYQPTVTSVNPTTLENSGAQSITVAGINFKSDAFVTLIKTGSTNITGTGTSVVTGSNASLTASVNLTGVSIGPWDVKITNAGDNESQTLASGLLVTNATPVVASILPSTGTNATIVTATLSGSFFRGGLALPAISLTKVGQPADILGTSVTVLNSTTARCVFNLAGMGPGTWNVVYGHGDDLKFGILVNGFTITAATPVIVSGIQADAAGNSGPVTFTISGAGFYPGLSTRLVMGSSVISGTGVAFINGALAKTATSSATISIPANAVDGNPTTYWETNSALPQWLKVNLGAVAAVTKVVLNWDNTYFGQNYTIDVSTDNLNWTTGTSVSSFSAGGSVTHYLNNSGQYVRVNVTTGSSGSTLRLKEFEIYSSDRLVCTFDLTGAAQGRWSPYVTNSDGNEYYLTAGLKVYGPPRVDAIDLSSGLNTAPITVTITGDNFLTVTAVKFNDPSSTAASGYTVSSENQIVATFPTINNSGRFDPIVTALGGSNTSAAQHFDLLIPQNLGSDQVVNFIDNTKVIVPSSTFNDDVAVVISQTMSNPSLVATANSGIKGNLIRIYPAIANNMYELSLSKPGTSFNIGRAVTLKIKYNGINDPNIEKNLRIFELDPVRSMWKLVSEDQTVDMVSKTVSVSLVHFSFYRLAYAGKYGSDLSDVESYPNPVSFDTAVNNTVKFVRLVVNTNVNIYTLSGELVLSLPAGTNNGKTYNDAANGVAEWDGTNTRGEKVVRGLYMVLFRDSDGHKSVKKIVVK